MSSIGHLPPEYVITCEAVYGAGPHLKRSITWGAAWLLLLACFAESIWKSYTWLLKRFSWMFLHHGHHLPESHSPIVVVEKPHQFHHMLAVAVMHEVTSQEVPQAAMRSFLLRSWVMHFNLSFGLGNALGHCVEWFRMFYVACFLVQDTHPVMTPYFVTWPIRAAKAL